MELFWVTTTLTNHPVDDNLPRYKAWETEAALYVSIDVLDHHLVIRHLALEGHTALTARGLLVIVAYALHHLAYIADEEESTQDPVIPDDLVESFSFSETKKKSLAAKFCTILCDTVSDKTTLLEIGGVILPLDCHTIFVTFAPTVDDTARTAQPRELRLALIHHKKHLFKGDLTLQVVSSIPVSPDYLFQAALITLVFLDQTDKMIAPTERSRHGSDVLAGIAPQRHAPWLPALLRKTPEDSLEGFRPPPWILPFFTKGNAK